MSKFKVLPLLIAFLILASSFSFIATAATVQKGAYLITKNDVSNASNQKWVFKNLSVVANPGIGTGIVYFTTMLMNKETGLYLTDNNGTLVQSTLTGNDNQVWKFRDHWTYNWFVSNKETNRGLKLYNGITLLDNLSYDGLEQTAISSGDLNAPITSTSGLSEGGEYYLYSKLIDNTHLGVLVGNSLKSVQNVSLTDKNSLTNADNQKWVFKNLSVVANPGVGEGKVYFTTMLMNKETGLYLTDNNGTLVQSTLNGNDNQVWEFRNNWLNTWFVTNKATNRQLQFSGGIITMLTTVTYGGSQLIAISSSISSGNFSDPISSTAGLSEGGEYYIYFKIVPNNTQLAVLIGELSKGLKLDTRSEALNADSQKWIVENVTIINENTATEVIFTAKLKNKATGLYLTDMNGTATQEIGNSKDNQVWQFGNWYDNKFRVTNKQTGNQLILINQISLKPSTAIDYAGSGYCALSTGDLDVAVTNLSQITSGSEFYFYNKYWSSVENDVPCLLTSDSVTFSGFNENITRNTNTNKLDKTITNINAGTKVSYLRTDADFDSSATTLEFTAENGTTPLADTDTVGTGMKVAVKVNGVKTDIYSIVMYGDVTGEGNINVGDLAAMKLHLLKQTSLTNAKLLAGDTTRDGKITISDLIMLKKSLLNFITINQDVA